MYYCTYTHYSNMYYCTYLHSTYYSSKHYCNYLHSTHIIEALTIVNVHQVTIHHVTLHHDTVHHFTVHCVTTHHAIARHMILHIMILHIMLLYIVPLYMMGAGKWLNTSACVSVFRRLEVRPALFCLLWQFTCYLRVITCSTPKAMSGFIVCMW